MNHNSYLLVWESKRDKKTLDLKNTVLTGLVEGIEKLFFLVKATIMKGDQQRKKKAQQSFFLITYLITLVCRCSLFCAVPNSLSHRQWEPAVSNRGCKRHRGPVKHGPLLSPPPGRGRHLHCPSGRGRAVRYLGPGGCLGSEDRLTLCPVTNPVPQPCSPNTLLKEGGFHLGYIYV